MENNDNPNFTDKFNEFEEIVSKLRSSSLPLDESIVLFKRGNELAKELHSNLKGYELEIIEIKKENDLPVELPSTDD